LTRRVVKLQLKTLSCNDSNFYRWNAVKTSTLLVQRRRSRMTIFTSGDLFVFLKRFKRLTLNLISDIAITLPHINYNTYFITSELFFQRLWSLALSRCCCCCCC